MTTLQHVFMWIAIGATWTVISVGVGLLFGGVLRERNRQVPVEGDPVSDFYSAPHDIGKSISEVGR